MTAVAVAAAVAVAESAVAVAYGEATTGPLLSVLLLLRPMPRDADVADFRRCRHGCSPLRLTAVTRACR